MKERIENLKKNFKSIEDVIKFFNPSEEDKILLNYNGTNSRLLGARAFMLLEIVADIFNTRPDGTKWIPNWNDYNDYKWYPWFKMNAKTPSGVGFSRSYYVYWAANSSVGSRLCFEHEELSDLSAELFPELYITILKK